MGIHAGSYVPPVGKIPAKRSGLIAKTGRQFKQQNFVTNKLTVLNKTTLWEASGMKRLLHSMTAASIAAGVALASSNPVGASDKETPDSAQNTTVNEPSVLAQNAIVSPTVIQARRRPDINHIQKG
jgi:predicted phage tail protein